VLQHGSFTKRTGENDMARTAEQNQRKNLRERLRRANETEEERDTRLANLRAHKEKAKSNWTTEKREAERERRRRYDRARTDIPEKRSKSRGLGCIRLFPNPFPPDVEIHWHHLADRMHVVAVPAHIHNKAAGCIPIELHHKRMEPFLFATYGIQPAALATT